MSASLELRSVGVSYGSAVVLDGLSLTVVAGECLALLGPSGCGKTTTLKTIAGLVQPLEGEILLGGEPITQRPAEKRDIGMVFQNPLLFPHLPVFENVAFGLKMRKLPPHEIRKRVLEALEMVRLEGFEARRPRELSGGQEQRVALARALVTHPRVLLLDEPFSALDENLREEMREETRALQRRLRITTIFVTHDQQEAASVADRVALMLDGRIVQAGRPRELYLSPQTARVARFFGWQVFEGSVAGGILETAIGHFAVQGRADGRACIAFRPESARLASEACTDLELAGVVRDVVYTGSTVRYSIATPFGGCFRMERALDECLEVGREVVVRVPSDCVIFF